MGNMGRHDGGLGQRAGSGDGKDLTGFLIYFSSGGDWVCSWVSGEVEETVCVLIILRNSVL